MNKTLKILGLAVAVLVGVLVIAIILLPFVFDPNQYKGEIISLVKNKTGRDLKIEKKIGWSFFPRLGVEAGGLELSNAAGFGKEPFAKIEAAGVHVELLPLFSGNIRVDTVYLHGLTLNLAKNSAGQNNWQDLAAQETAAAKPETPKRTPDGKSARAPGNDVLAGLSVGRLDIRRATVSWRDATAGSTLTVRNLELATGKFVPAKPVDLHLGFELQRDKKAPIKAALQTRVTAAADSLALEKLDLKLDDSRLTGSMELRNFASPSIRFTLALDKIDLDRYLDAAPASGRTASGAKDATASGAKQAPAAQPPVELPLSTLRSLDAKGSFAIQEMKALGLHSKDVQIKLNAKNGLLVLGPNHASLYGGKYLGETTLDIRGKTPQLKMQEKVEQVQVGPMLKDMQLFDNYTGTGNIDLKLTAQGFDADQIKKTLNGTAVIAFRDGRISGIDLERIYQIANSGGSVLDKVSKIIPKKDDVTKFGEMGASFAIAKGVAATNDLTIRLATLSVSGRGTEDLVHETNNMRIDLVEQKNAGKKCMNLPLRIRGTFDKPDLKVDDEFLKCKAQKGLEKELQKGLGDLLQKRKRK